MTAMEMDAKKAMLIRELMNIEDMDVLKKVERLFRRATKKEEDPYFKDPENLKRLDEAIEEMKNGEVVRLTRDELKLRLGL